jgi:GMP synthase-like glutamine amidotransferase
MTRALVVTHSPTEGVGNVGTWLEAKGVELEVVEPWDGDDVPQDPGQYDAVVVMGGPQQAYDDGSAPWLRATKDLLRKAVDGHVPTLGVCLGAQLLAEATGGRVAKGDEGVEAGARLVAKRDAAWDDELFADVPFTPTVVQWHEDAIVDLPPGRFHLASSSRYAHQAFRIGDRAMGACSSTSRRRPRWCATGARSTARGRGGRLDPFALAERAVEELDEVEACWRPVVERFAALAAGRGRVTLPIVAASEPSCGAVPYDHRRARYRRDGDELSCRYGDGG